MAMVPANWDMTGSNTSNKSDARRKSSLLDRFYTFSIDLISFYTSYEYLHSNIHMNQRSLHTRNDYNLITLSLQKGSARRNSIGMGVLCLIGSGGMR